MKGMKIESVAMSNGVSLAKTGGGFFRRVVYIAYNDRSPKRWGHKWSGESGLMTCSMLGFSWYHVLAY